MPGPLTVGASSGARAAGHGAARYRPPAAVVVPAWNAWECTRACLSSLRPTLGPRDEVVVVDNGSTDQTPVGLSQFPWVKVVRNEENRGFAVACNQGAAASTAEIVVFLNSDTVPVGRWLDQLLAPFSDLRVSATGARSNFVSGPQLVTEARYSTIRELKGFEKSWRRDNDGRTDEAQRLVGFCIAVRRDAFDAVGGFDEAYREGGYEDDDLCHRLVAAGGKLLIAHGSYVHHVGHASFDANKVDWVGAEMEGRKRFLLSAEGDSKDKSAISEAGARPRSGGTRRTEGTGGTGGTEGTGHRPRISACLIVKDEEHNIGRCLESLKGVVDEVVVGDTGSCDATASIARSYGAVVVDVAWEDDFAKARNQSLSHCHGDWVLWIDADEEWVGDGDELHDVLASSPPDLDGWLVVIDNEMGNGTEARTSHPAVRVFRRGLSWKGRVHEQVDHPGRDTLVARLTDAGSIVHHGYTSSALVGLGKLERNLRLAELALADAVSGIDVQRAELNMGRCLLAIGRLESSLEHLDRAASGPEPPTTRLALHASVRAAFAARDLEGASERISSLRKASASPLLADILTGELAWRAKLYEEALSVLSRIQLPAYDDDKFLHTPSEVAHILADCYRTAGRPGDAFEALLGPLASEGVCQEPLSVLVHDACVASPDERRRKANLARIGKAFPAGTLRMWLAQVIQLDDYDSALDILEGALGPHSGDGAVLAAAGIIAVKASPQAALPWAARMRSEGVGQCPLLTIAGDAGRSTEHRVLAAAAALKAFSDDRAGLLLEALVPLTPPSSREAVRAILEPLAPSYVGLLPAPEAPRSVADGGQVGMAEVERVGAVRARPSRPRPVSIVVPCWNRAEWTLRLLQSLQETLPDGGYELVIVDNGSTDATSKVQPNPDAGVVVVRNEKNLGFAVACNQGAKAASAETLVFCNNDVVAKPGWLPPLLATLERPDVGVVGPKLVFPDGTLQHAGVALLYDADGGDLLDGMHILYRQGADHPAANRPRELRAVTGAVMAVRASLFESLGGFYEGYWNGNEDVDLCLSAGEAGWHVRYEPASVLVHQESASGTERFRATGANRMLLTTRWAAKVTDERVTDGALVVGPFGAGSGADTLARHLVSLADKAEVPVVTRAWPRRSDGWAHRLGPGQSLVLSSLSPEETAEYVAAEGDYLPEGVTVLAGEDELAGAGLLGDGAVSALVGLRCKRGTSRG